MPNEVLEQDKPLAPMTSAEFSSRMNTEKGFADAYLRDPARYEAAITDLNQPAPQAPEAAQPAPGSDPAAAPQGQPAAAAPTTPNSPDEMVSVTIPRNMLGTYGINRSPQEGIAEALKGLSEKDRVIEMLRARDEESHGEKLSLREKLRLYDEAKAVAPQAPAASPSAAVPAAAPSTDFSDLNLDDLPEDESLFEPENIKKLAASNKKMVQLLRKQAQELASVSKTTSDLQTARQGEDVAAEQRSIRDRALRSEFNEIEELQRVEPALKTTQSFQDLDRSVVQFIKDIGYVAGTGKGDYNDAAIAAANRFLNDKTPAGDELRALAAKNGITPPSDIDKHAQIMAIRAERQRTLAQVRRTMEDKTGRKFEDHEVPLPFTYADFYRRLVPNNTAQSVLAARIEGASAVAKASATDKFAREVPPEAGRTDIALSSLGEAELRTLLAKPSNKYTQQEATLVMQYYESQQIPVPNEVKMRAKPG
jgi:hypothetical protein